MTENISPPAVVCVLGLTLRDFGQQPVARQAKSKTALERLIETVIASVPATERVVLDAPDGAVVVSLQGPDEVLALAEHAQKLAPADLSLCLGVNYGPVGVATLVLSVVLSAIIKEEVDEAVKAEKATASH